VKTDADGVARFVGGERDGAWHRAASAAKSVAAGGPGSEAQVELALRPAGPSPAS
jgi:hypothetical protein